MVNRSFIANSIALLSSSIPGYFSLTDVAIPLPKSHIATESFCLFSIYRINENATPSVLLGFNLDTSKIETELANCRAVYEKYYSEFFTGAQDPRELIKTIEKELETAGWETIRAEAQKQIDAAK